MGGLFSSPKMPAPVVQAPPPVPSAEDEAAKAAEGRRKALEADARRRGRQATILTGPEGLGETGVTQPKATLG